MTPPKERVIVVSIDEEGRIEAETEGFSGTTCLQELSRLLRDLGVEEGSVERKPDEGVQRVRTRATHTLRRER